MQRTRMAIGAMAVGVLLLAGCGSGSSGGSGYGSGATTTSAGGSSTSTAAGSTVSVASTGTIGDHLVAPDGHTLYLFQQDKGTTSACTGSCADNWPALTAASPTAGDGVDGTKLTTATGQVADQVVYDGHLLYEFAGDQAAGDANGVGIPGWFPVGADGAPIGG